MLLLQQEKQNKTEGGLEVKKYAACQSLSFQCKPLLMFPVST